MIMEEVESYVTALGDKIDLQDAKILKLIENIERNGVERNTSMSDNNGRPVSRKSDNECDDCVISSLKEEAWKQVSYLKHAKEEIDWLRRRNEELQKRDVELTNACINYESTLADFVNASKEQQLKIDIKVKEIEDMKIILEQRIMAENDSKMQFYIKDMEYCARLAEKDEYISEQEGFIQDLQLQIYELEYEVMQANEAIEENELDILNKDESLREAEIQVEELENDNEALLEKIHAIKENSEILYNNLFVIEKDLIAKDDEISRLTEEKGIDFDKLQGREEIILEAAGKINFELEKQLQELKSEKDEQKHAIQIYMATGSRTAESDSPLNCLFDRIEQQQQQIFQLQDNIDKKDTDIMELEENNIDLSAKLNALLATEKESELAYVTKFNGAGHSSGFNGNVVTYGSKRNHKYGLACPCMTNCYSERLPSACAKTSDLDGLPGNVLNERENSNCQKGQDCGEISNSKVQLILPNVIFGSHANERRVCDVLMINKETLTYSNKDQNTNKMETQTAEISFFENDMMANGNKTEVGESHTKNDAEDTKTYVIAFTTDNSNQSSMAKMEEPVKISGSKDDLDFNIVRVLSNNLPVADGSDGNIVTAENSEVQHLSVSFDSDGEESTVVEDSKTDKPDSSRNGMEINANLIARKTSVSSDSGASTDASSDNEETSGYYDLESKWLSDAVEEKLEISIEAMDDNKPETETQTVEISFFENDESEIANERLSGQSKANEELDKPGIVNSNPLQKQQETAVMSDNAPEKKQQIFIEKSIAIMKNDDEMETQTFEISFSENEEPDIPNEQLPGLSAHENTRMSADDNKNQEDDLQGNAFSGEESVDKEVEDILKNESGLDSAGTVEDEIYQYTQEDLECSYAPCDGDEIDGAAIMDSDYHHREPKLVSFKGSEYHEKENVEDDIDSSENLEDYSAMITLLKVENINLKVDNERMRTEHSKMCDEFFAMEKEMEKQNEVIRASEVREDYLVEVNKHLESKTAELNRDLEQQRLKNEKVFCENCPTLRESNIRQKFEIEEMRGKLLEANSELEKVKAEVLKARQDLVEKQNIVIIETENYESKKSKKKRRSLFCAS